MGCQDLAAVVRRLTLCSMQLGVVTTSAPRPNDMFSILDDIVVQTSLLYAHIDVYVGWESLEKP